jgi:hypothetical protein
MQTLLHLSKLPLKYTFSPLLLTFKLFSFFSFDDLAYEAIVKRL